MFLTVVLGFTDSLRWQVRGTSSVFVHHYVLLQCMSPGLFGGLASVFEIKIQKASFRWQGAHLLDIACIIERHASAIFSLLKIARTVLVSIASEIFAHSVCAPFGLSFTTV